MKLDSRVKMTESGLVSRGLNTGLHEVVRSCNPNSAIVISQCSSSSSFLTCRIAFQIERERERKLRFGFGSESEYAMAGTGKKE